MGFSIALQTKSIPSAVLAAKVTSTKPLFFHRGEMDGQSGVFSVVRHSGGSQAYFYPDNVILDRVAPNGGREEYVYKEGFDPEKSANTIAPMVIREVERWRPRLASPRDVGLDGFLIQQPGINMWRMLCIALDHSSAPTDFLDNAPPLFSVWSARLILHSGNHRALFALASEVPTVRMTWITIPSRAVQYRATVEALTQHVQNRFGTKQIQALAHDFVRQVEREA